MSSVVELVDPQRFRFYRADDWGMSWTSTPLVEHLPDGEMYVHHTGGGRWADDGPTAFRALNRWAQTPRPGGKGYSAIDYDMLVHRSPSSGVVSIGEARGRYRSAATLDRNELGEAVALLGMFHPGHRLSERPHPDEVEGVALAIAWSIELGHTAPDAWIAGHRDNPSHPDASPCPGDYLWEELDTIRRRVAELVRLMKGSHAVNLIPITDRLYDSRQDPAGKLGAGEVRTLPLGELGRDAVALSLNVTLAEPSPAGHVTVWGAGGKPRSSNVNMLPAGAIANAALVHLDGTNTLRVFASHPTHLVLDVQGVWR